MLVCSFELNAGRFDSEWTLVSSWCAHLSPESVSWQRTPWLTELVDVDDDNGDFQVRAQLEDSRWIRFYLSIFGSSSSVPSSPLNSAEQIVGLLPPCNFFGARSRCVVQSSIVSVEPLLPSQTHCIGCPSCRCQWLGQWFRNVGGKQAVLVRCLDLYPLISFIQRGADT